MRIDMKIDKFVQHNVADLCLAKKMWTAGNILAGENLCHLFILFTELFVE